MGQSRFCIQGWLPSKDKRLLRELAPDHDDDAHKHWRERGDAKREARGRKIVAHALKHPTRANIASIQVHIDGYRAAAIHMKISVKDTLDRLLPGWKKIEILTRRLASAPGNR